MVGGAGSYHFLYSSSVMSWRRNISSTISSEILGTRRPFFTKFTEEVVTSWITLSDVPADLGPLYLIKGSDQFEDHLSTTRGFDLMKQTDRQASILDHPDDYVEKRGTKLMTKEFL